MDGRSLAATGGCPGRGGPSAEPRPQCRPGPARPRLGHGLKAKSPCNR